MEMEMPFKMILYIAVVIILIGIMITFRSKIVEMCLFSSCEKEKAKCNVKEQYSTETISDGSDATPILEKYCDLCWRKNNEGDCRENSVCYIVKLTESSNSATWIINGLPDYCDASKLSSGDCNREISSFFVNYDSIKKKIIIEC